mmetsp:Transcript_17507/g.44025  ORF Transcript_17507/g.44025 Transcript_17507/m.44025 type:complete len:371 (-) Transcript_17507:18-1130(-)
MEHSHLQWHVEAEALRFLWLDRVQFAFEGDLVHRLDEPLVLEPSRRLGGARVHRHDDHVLLVIELLQPLGVTLAVRELGQVYALDRLVEPRLDLRSPRPRRVFTAQSVPEGLHCARERARALGRTLRHRLQLGGGELYVLLLLLGLEAFERAHAILLRLDHRGGPHLRRAAVDFHPLHLEVDLLLRVKVVPDRRGDVARVEHQAEGEGEAVPDARTHSVELLVPDVQVGDRDFRAEVGPELRLHPVEEGLALGAGVALLQLRERILNHALLRGADLLQRPLALLRRLDHEHHPVDRHLDGVGRPREPRHLHLHRVAVHQPHGKRKTHRGELLGEHVGPRVQVDDLDVPVLDDHVGVRLAVAAVADSQVWL